MATAGGPKIVTDGLVFGYDNNYGVADNDTATRFYAGEPTNNLLSNVDDWSSGWTGNLFGNWINATVTANAGVAPDGTTTASKLTGGYSRWQRINCSTNTTYTFSFWIKNIDLPIAPQIHIAFGLNGTLVNYNNVTTIALNTIGEWTRVSKTHTSPSSGINQMEVGVTWSSNYPNTDSVLVWHAMCEQNAHLTPFTAGTRSATEGLKDLTGNSTIDLTNVSFDSDAQMTFDGSSDHISLTGDILNVDSFTIEAIVNITSVGNYNKPIFVAGDTSSTGIWFFKHRSGLGNRLVMHGYDGVNPRIDVDSVNQVPDAENTYVAVTFNGNAYQLYMNGEPEDSPVVDNKVGATTANYIGKQGRTYLNGDIPMIKRVNQLRIY